MIKILVAVLGNRSLLVPTYKLDNVSQILTIPELMSPDKKIFIFDKDDTLVSLHEFQVTNPQTAKLLSTLHQSQKQIYIVSNSIKTPNPTPLTYPTSQPTSTTHTLTSIPILHTPTPKPHNHLQITQQIETTPQNLKNNLKLNSTNTVVVGDRLFTDVLLGNFAGWVTVLVRPVEPTTIGKHGLGVYVMRKIQDLIVYWF